MMRTALLEEEATYLSRHRDPYEWLEKERTWSLGAGACVWIDKERDQRDSDLLNIRITMRITMGVEEER